MGNGFRHIPAFLELLSCISAEEFSKSNRFSDLSLEEIGGVLEKINGASLPENQRESFERTLSLYHLVLLDLELHNRNDFPPEKLGVLLQVEQNTQNKHLEFFPRAREYADAGLRLLDLERMGHLKLPKGFAQRLSALMSCSAIQLELQGRILPLIEKQWGNREIFFKSAYEIQNGKVRPSAKIISELKVIEGEHPEWISGAEIDVEGLALTLKYLLLLEKPELLRPSLMELGFLQVILTSLHQFKDSAAWNESAFKAMRLHKVKLRCLSIESDFGEELWQIFTMDYHRLLELLPGLETSARSSDEKKVA